MSYSGIEGFRPAARRWLSPREASDYTGISRSWLAKLRMHGAGPAYAKIGKAVRYSTDSLERWMADNTRSSTLGARQSGSIAESPE